MDPLCGGTRATHFFMTGEWGSAWRYNPGIFVLALVFGLGLSRWVYGRSTGHWLDIRIGRRTVALALAVGLVVLEVNQQMNANLLIQS